MTMVPFSRPPTKNEPAIPPSGWRNHGRWPGRTARPAMADGLLPIVEAIATGDPIATRWAISGLGPALRRAYDQGESAWQAGAPADFLAATLYASPRYFLRVHAHAAGAVDSDLHTHKGTVYSTVLSGQLVNTAAKPVLTDDRRGLDVWRCACLSDGSHVQELTGLRATVDPDTLVNEHLGRGSGFIVRPGDYHRLAISRANEPTVTLCLFEQLDPDAPDAVVLTGRSSPMVAAREMTAAAARAALRRVLDRVKEEPPTASEVRNRR